MKRLIAAFVALLLVFTLIPAMDVEAASLPKLNVASRTIYVGGSKVMTGKYAVGTYQLKVKNKTAKYSCGWSTDNPEVASVTKQKGGKALVTALKPGTAIVTADFVDKVSNTRYKLTCKVTVKKNCSAINVSGYNGSQIKVGSKIQLTPALFDEAGKEMEAGTDTTDIVKWVSADTKVATVTDKGVLTAVGGGKTEVTCFTVQTSSSSA